MARPVEDRLVMVSTEVSPEQHADIGTDHALLPLYLLSHRLCRFVIATEKSASAFRVAKRALWGRQAEVRQGDGLGVLEPGEVQSVSICGLGGTLIADILSRGEERLPPRVVVQANRDSWKLRRWGLRNGFHLLREQLAEGHWLYEILTFQKAPGPDPAYFDVPLDLALHFGPHLLKERHPLRERDLCARKEYLFSRPRREDLQRVNSALNFWYSS